MTKPELAGYMASLLTLLEHQDKSGVHLRSQEIGAEFERCWGQLKELIDKEKENARQSEQQRERAKNSAADERGQSGRGSTDRLGPNETERVPAFERSRPIGSTDVVNNPSRR